MSTTFTTYKNLGKLKKQDNYNTPANAWEDILQFIKKERKLWLPFYNDGGCLKMLYDMSYNNVVHLDKDYFSYDISDALIIDNPMWSRKREIMDRIIKEERKCALLLPLDTMERKYFKKYLKNFQIVIPLVRYRYESNYNTFKNLATQKCSPPFKSCWFCWNMEDELNSKEKIIWL